MPCFCQAAPTSPHIKITYPHKINISPKLTPIQTNPLPSLTQAPFAAQAHGLRSSPTGFPQATSSGPPQLPHPRKLPTATWDRGFKIETFFGRIG